MHNRGRARRGGRARFKAHAWNACRLERVSGVRIPPSPPHSALGESFLYDGLNAVQTQGLGGAIGFNLLTGLALDENFTVNGETIMTDALGSVIGTVGPSGTLDTTFEYDPFGNTTFSGQDNGGFWQFAGRENDLSGLYYMRARYYSPTLQRFISQDPHEFDGVNSNVYAYAGNMPIIFGDPLGLTQVVIGINRDNLEKGDQQGTLDVGGQQIGYTMDPGVVPPGSYPAEYPYYGPKHPHDPRILLDNVPNLSGIEIHRGSLPGQSSNCFLVGRNRQPHYVGQSRQTERQLQSLINVTKAFDQGLGEATDIMVNVKGGGPQILKGPSSEPQ